jgi:DNA-binding transcriptional regulator YdaS (Cro superfamily)
MTTATNPVAAKAILLLGGITKAAVRLNPYRQPGAPELTPAAVCNWAKRGIPICYCIPIEKETERAILCEEMRPDMDWGYLRASSAHDGSTVTKGNIGALKTRAHSQDYRSNNTGDRAASSAVRGQKKVCRGRPGAR